MSPTDQRPTDWIEDIELEDAQVKWAWSHFDGREDTFNASGEYNFVVAIPEKQAQDLLAEGWAIKEYPGYEEGDPPEYTLKVRIGLRYEPPKMYLIKNGRKFRITDPRDLADIRRDTCEQISVIITPNKWVHGGRSGVTAYVKELYAKVKTSRFESMYDDYEEA